MRASEQDSKTRDKGASLNLWLSALLILCVARLWLMPLPSSFWVDEIGTAFVVQRGAADPSLRVAPQVPASLYYALPRIASNFFGPSEVVYRLPSVLAMAIALWLIALIARRLIHPEAGWFVVFACLFLREFDYQAADARPYALGTCLTCASLWFLIRWLDSARWRDALLFAATGSLLWRVHLIFWPVYLVFAVYTLVRLTRADTSVGRFRVLAVFALMGASLIPVLATAIALYREAGAHVVAPSPTFAALTASLKLGLITAMCAAAALISRWFRWPRVESVVSLSALSLILAWWLCDPLCLFAFSRLTGTSVFVPRYLWPALPGAAVAAVVVAGAFIPPRYWRPLSAALALIVLLVMGRWSQLWPAHHNSDWRGTARGINRQSFGSDVPVICPSPFIEARPPVWRPDYPTSSFLYSQLLVYPINGKVYPFPYESSPEAREFAEELSRVTLAASGRFVIYGQDPSVRFWQEWFGARPNWQDGDSANWVDSAMWTPWSLMDPAHPAGNSSTLLAAAIEGRCQVARCAGPPPSQQAYSRPLAFARWHTASVHNYRRRSPHPPIALPPAP